MNRFRKKQHRIIYFRQFLSVVLFCAFIGSFLYGLRSVSDTAARTEMESLRSAVIHGAVQCYALEGFYPEDLTYLEENYGLTYDHSKYLVAYEVVGSNLMPDVTVFPLKGEDGS